MTAAASPPWRLVDRDTPASTRLLLGLLVSGAGPGLAVLLTNPMDVVKARLQMQDELLRRDPSRPPPYGSSGSPIGTLRAVARAEGFQGLYRGVGVAVTRDSCKCFFRIGLFDPLLSVLHPPSPPGRAQRAQKPGPPPLWKLLVAGGVSGAVASILFNPLDVAKTRFQSAGGATPSHHNNYRSAFASLWDIARDEGGPRALWKGTTTNVLRAVTFNSVMLTVNFRVRHHLACDHGMGDGPVRDALGSLTGALAGVLVMNPVDVVRTRLYNEPAGGQQLYGGSVARGSSFASALARIVAAEGLPALWKGTAAHAARVLPYTLFAFLFIGKMKREIGLTSSS